MRRHRTHWGARLWVTFLSVTFAVLLFPSIVNLHGIGMSLVFTGLGVGFIWSLYFAIGRLIMRSLRNCGTGGSIPVSEPAGLQSPINSDNIH